MSVANSLESVNQSEIEYSYVVYYTRQESQDSFTQICIRYSRHDDIPEHLWSTSLSLVLLPLDCRSSSSLFKFKLVSTPTE
jgi:hypothetical protein